MSGRRARTRLCRIAHDADTAGFTLLELLVVLAVMGALLVGLAQGLHFGVQLWDRQRQVLDSVSELDAADRALRGLIERMDPGGHLEMADIDGTARTLRFTTELPMTAGALRTRRAEAMLEVDRLHRLVLRWIPSPHGTPLVPEVPVETVLLNGVDHIEISYRPASPVAGWQADWQNAIPPRLVRIHIAFARADPRTWPDIVTAPVLERGGG
jgi:general secretion pathway protein J